MKVLHVAETVHGGIATYLDEIIPYQEATFSKENIHILIPKNQKECITTTDPNIITFTRTGRNLASFASLLSSYKKAIKGIQPDIVHVHSTFAGVIIRLFHLIKKSKRPKIIYCAHGWSFSMNSSKLKKNLYAFIERLLQKTTDKIICISEFEKKLAITHGITADKCIVIYNGITEHTPSPTPIPLKIRNKKIKILFVGRFHEAKGFDLLPDLFSKLESSHHLYIAGEAILENESTISSKNKNITLLGWQNKNNLQFLYNLVDAVIVPSRWEAFGFVPIEAMRAGKAVIASNCGALPETVKHKKNGILIDILNIDQATRDIQSIKHDDLRKFGDAGKEIFINNFTSKSTNKALIDTYRKLKNEP